MITYLGACDQTEEESFDVTPAAIIEKGSGWKKADLPWEDFFAQRPLEAYYESTFIPENNNVELLANEKTLPDDFHEKAIRRENPPFFRYLVSRVDNQEAYEEVSDLFRFKQSLKSVNFEENHVFFIGFQESGTCPYSLKWVENKEETLAFELTRPNPEAPCTYDATPRAFVLQVSQDISNQYENMLIEENNEETVVPIR